MGRTPRRHHALSGTSGSEQTYSDFFYGTPTGIRANNCYAYAIDYYGTKEGYKMQPGDISRGTSRELDLATCGDVSRRALKDNPTMYPLKPSQKCKPGFYKVMLFLDENNDYHWYKQHLDVLYRAKRGDTPQSISSVFKVPVRDVIFPKKGNIVMVKNARIWSHKRGLATGPLLKDSCGRVITDPRKACRNYGLYNYEVECGSFCAQNYMYESKKTKKPRVSVDSKKKKKKNITATRGVTRDTTVPFGRRPLNPRGVVKKTTTDSKMMMTRSK